VDDANQVAIYQGVPGKIVGLHLSSVYRTTDLHLGELTSSDQELVKQTIPVGSLGDANQAVDKLRIDQVNGPGAPVGCQPSPSPTAPLPSGAPTPLPSAGSTAATPTTPTGKPSGTGTAAVVPTPRGTGRTPVTPKPTTAPTTVTPSPSLPAAPSPSPSC
jgi:protein phosphatase